MLSIPYHSPDSHVCPSAQQKTGPQERRGQRDTKRASTPGGCSRGRTKPGRPRAQSRRKGGLAERVCASPPRLPPATTSWVPAYMIAARCPRQAVSCFTRHEHFGSTRATRRTSVGKGTRQGRTGEHQSGRCVTRSGTTGWMLSTFGTQAMKSMQTLLLGIRYAQLRAGHGRGSKAAHFPQHAIADTYRAGRMPRLRALTKLAAGLRGYRRSVSHSSPAPLCGRHFSRGIASWLAAWRTQRRRPPCSRSPPRGCSSWCGRRPQGLIAAAGPAPVKRIPLRSRCTRGPP